MSVYRNIFFLKTGQILKYTTGAQQKVKCCNTKETGYLTGIQYTQHGEDGPSGLLVLRTLHYHKFNEHTMYNSLRNLCWVLHLPSQQYQLCVPVQKEEQEWAVHHQICGCCPFQPLGNYNKNIKFQCDHHVHAADNWSVRFCWKSEESSQ